MRLFAFLILIASTTALAAPASGVFGDWKTPQGAVVRVAPCGADGRADVCLTAVKLSPTVTETTDQKNPDASLRNRRLCGLAIGAGFHQADPGHLTGGSIYDPESGHTYHGAVTSEGDKLHLRGYIGISLFGRTETWHRVPAVAACQ